VTSPITSYYGLSALDKTQAYRELADSSDDGLGPKRSSVAELSGYIQAIGIPQAIS
jgi:hypothetical protein